DGKRTSIKDLTSKFDEANVGPVPQVINLAGKPFSNGSKLSASSLSKDDVDAKTNEGPSARSEISQKLEAEILELRAEVKRLREHSVSKEEFNNLVSQMKTLQETMESNRAHYSKMVRDLMAEVDEEKKQRMTLQVEIDRLKKITVTV
ncbi:uncharacterized protein LOC100905170, partial [Galendromus occidentalis]|uniref:Uncharacterized protein LOC100905170 n=1 Tax=Galendromus occidentalis TaxID=34638 RepID=A0AAJ6QNK9_9ACAR